MGTSTLFILGLPLTLLHSERPKLCAILAFLSAIGLRKEFPIWELGVVEWCDGAG